MDGSTTIGDLRDEVEEFVAERNWTGYHTPKNLAMGIAIEAAEIMEHFQWITVAESIELTGDLSIKVEIADELADVLIYCLSFANATDIDISSAIRAKLARNQRRFPIEKVSGKLGPYSSD